MQLKINSKRLLTALNMCKGALSKTPVVPACEYFHISGNGKLNIAACNMEVSLETTLDAELTEPIDLLLPGEKILAVLAKLPDQSITMDISTDYQIRLTHSAGYCEFAGMPGIDFPTLKTDKGQAISIPAEDLQYAIYTSAYARGSVDDALVFISGLNVDISKTGADFVASNRYVMAKSHIGGKFKDAKILMPVSIVNIISGLKLIGDVTLEISETTISLQCSDLTAKSRLMGEKFPAWSTMIPECDIVTTVNRSELLASVKRVMDFSNKSNNKLILTCSDNLKLSTEDIDFKQQATETINAEISEFEIGVNGNLLGEVLGHISSETVLLKFKDYRSALIIQDPDNLEDLALVMAIV